MFDILTVKSGHRRYSRRMPIPRQHATNVSEEKTLPPKFRTITSGTEAQGITEDIWKSESLSTQAGILAEIRLLACRRPQDRWRSEKQGLCLSDEVFSPLCCPEKRFPSHVKKRHGQQCTFFQKEEKDKTVCLRGHVTHEENSFSRHFRSVLLF